MLHTWQHPPHLVQIRGGMLIYLVHMLLYKYMAKIEKEKNLHLQPQRSPRGVGGGLWIGSEPCLTPVDPIHFIYFYFLFFYIIFYYYFFHNNPLFSLNQNIYIFIYISGNPSFLILLTTRYKIMIALIKKEGGEKFCVYT